MVLKLWKYSNEPVDTLRETLLAAARFRIMHFKFTAAERAQEAYFLKIKHADLKSVCKQLLSRSQVLVDADGQHWLILFPNKEDDKLATLITYGNSELPGSMILRQAISLV